jgi:hypothetical protein
LIASELLVLNTQFSRIRDVSFADTTRYAHVYNSERWKLSTRVQRIVDTGTMEEDAELARIANVLRLSSRHSRLYQWMRKRHAKLLEQFAEDRPNWAALAAEFGAMELFDAKRKPPSAHVARRTWWQVRHDLAAKAARKKAKAAASAAGVQFVPPPTAAPPAQAAQITVPVGGFPPVEPEDEEPTVQRPRFGFARLRGRGAPGDGSSKD